MILYKSEINELGYYFKIKGYGNYSAQRLGYMIYKHRKYWFDGKMLYGWKYIERTGSESPTGFVVRVKDAAIKHINEICKQDKEAAEVNMAIKRKWTNIAAEIDKIDS